MIKAPIFSRQGFDMFQAQRVLEGHMLAMFSFSVINFYSAIQIGLYSLYRLYRKKVISAFKLNEKIVRSRYSFSRKNDDLSLASQAVKKKPPFCNTRALF